MTKKNLREFEEKIGVKFKDMKLLEQAFVHRSFINENGKSGLEHNERLEFLGDAVLELSVTDYLFHKFKNKTATGFLFGIVCLVPVKAFNTDDFPNIPKVSSKNSFTFNAPNLIKGLKSVVYSASVSTIRPTLSSVLIVSEEEDVIFVATDSFRLAEKKIGVKKHKDFNQILIPIKNISEIIRVLDDTKDDVEVFLNENQIAFAFNDIYLTSRVIDGTFPDYKQIIPKEVKTEVVLLKQDFLSSLKISNIFADKFSQVIFNISSKNKTLKISTKNMDVGENVTNIDAVIKGDDLIISFNYKYIIDCFQSVDSDSISLSFSDNNKPMVIKGVSDSSFLYLVMPMNK
jgi:DNA polymerase-3 subunit beta